MIAEISDGKRLDRAGWVNEDAVKILRSFWRTFWKILRLE